MLIQSCLRFASKLGNLVLDRSKHHISVDNVVSITPVSCDNGTESDILTALNSHHIGLAGTTTGVFHKSISFGFTDITFNRHSLVRSRS